MGSIRLKSSGSARHFGRSRAAVCDRAGSALGYGVAWLVGCGRASPARIRTLIARLEQAFAEFARVPYHDARSMRELEQVFDDLKD